MNDFRSPAFFAYEGDSTTYHPQWTKKVRTPWGHIVFRSRAIGRPTLSVEYRRYLHEVVVLDPDGDRWFRSTPGRTVPRASAEHVHLLDAIQSVHDALAGREPFDLRRAMWEAASSPGAAHAIHQGLSLLLGEVETAERLSVRAQSFEVGDVQREVAVRLAGIREVNQATRESLDYLRSQREVASC